MTFPNHKRIQESTKQGVMDVIRIVHDTIDTLFPKFRNLPSVDEWPISSPPLFSLA